MTKLRKVFYSYTGQRITRTEGQPTLLDIAVQLGRVCRYAGGSAYFWPSLLHSFIVADLTPERLEVYALLHDMTDAIFGDIPKPFKLHPMLELQNEMHNRFLVGFGLAALDPDDHQIIKQADTRAFVGEQNVVAPPGRERLFEPDVEAETLTRRYAAHYTWPDYLNADGRAVFHYIARVARAMTAAKEKGRG